MPLDSDQLIQRYGLIPHPEGGWYRELHRSPLLVQRPGGSTRSALTAILFLLKAGEISRWHRVAGADETWHFVGGDPLELFSLSPGFPVHRSLLAAPLPLLEASTPLAIVRADCWQAARTTGAWSLVSCCVAPGFDFDDFTLMRDLAQDRWPLEARVDWI